MKNIALTIALLGVAVSLVVAADKQGPAVEGVIVRLNEPGTILVEISVGRDDGLKTGDIFVVSRDEKGLVSSRSRRVSPIERRRTSSMWTTERRCEPVTGPKVNGDCDEAS